MCPFLAGHAHVHLSLGHPRARAHWRTLRCPFSAARAGGRDAPTLLVPGAPVSPRPLEHGQVPALCRVHTKVVPELLQGPFDSAHHHHGRARHARRRVRPAPPRDLPPRQGLLARRPRDPPALGGRAPPGPPGGGGARRARGRPPVVPAGLQELGGGRDGGRGGAGRGAPAAGEGHADARAGRGGERGARGLGDSERCRRASAEEVQERPLCLFCRGRAPDRATVGAGPRAPLKQENVRACNREWAPRSPPVGAGPGKPLGQKDVRVGCRRRAPQRSSSGRGPKGAPKTHGRARMLETTGNSQSSSGRGSTKAPNKAMRIFLLKTKSSIIPYTKLQGNIKSGAKTTVQT